MPNIGNLGREYLTQNTVKYINDFNLGTSPIEEVNIINLRCQPVMKY